MVVPVQVGASALYFVKKEWQSESFCMPFFLGRAVPIFLLFPALLPDIPPRRTWHDIFLHLFNCQTCGYILFFFCTLFMLQCDRKVEVEVDNKVIYYSKYF